MIYLFIILTGIFCFLWLDTREANKILVITNSGLIDEAIRLKKKLGEL